MESRNSREMTHALPFATQGSAQAQPWTVNWLAGRRIQRRILNAYKPAEALSDILWHDFDKWHKN